MADDCCAGKGKELERLAAQADQRRVLLIVLAINAVMFAAEFTAGIVAGSTALMADSVDMLGDALVYGLSIFAIARSDRWKGAAAFAKGVFILAFGIGILVDISIKLQTGVPPSSSLMLIFGGIALIANLACLRLLWRFRAQDVNMASTFECSRNDVISNVGVILAAAIVAATASPWPDIIVGGIIAALFLRSAVHVIRQSLPSLRLA
ncbi:cation diffusion facilitator family transporter [Novosphingopyxis sp.]|uniref:cation diffusion facilitator family transporter n=1 Tax=Novosphingopyxis sp. TaxID=2709690 RepID=UPI003B58E784